jgi:signal transduction histidine kinase/ligand-binding sensor domain-containing protein
MQRTILILAYFFICVNSFAQQYPFVHYTPKDGLASNRVRNIYQDSKGRIFFSTLNGLSVYDGARFTNYTTEDGLSSDIINCVMEMGNDSIWIAPNTNRLNCLVRSKVKTVALKDSITPVINFLCRNDAGDLYAAADDGLFLFYQNSFVKLPLQNLQGQDVNSYISQLIPYGNYLIIMRDYNLVSTVPKILYLFDCSQKKIVSQTSGAPVFTVAASKEGNVWLSTSKNIQQLDTNALKRGLIVQKELPNIFRDFSTNAGFIFFDNSNNCWISDGGQSLKKCDHQGNITVYTKSSGLSNSSIEYVFQDKEGIMWLASKGAGVEKLMHSNLSLIEKPFGFINTGMICRNNNGELILYSQHDKKMALLTKNDVEINEIKSTDQFFIVTATPGGLFGVSNKKIFRLIKKGSSIYTETIFNDSSQNTFGNTVVDKNGNLIIIGSQYLTALRNNSVSQVPVSDISDQVAVDKENNVWIATRTDQLIRFSIHPENVTNYLKKELVFEKELKDLEPRSIAIDHKDNIWIGTRYKGLYVFRLEKEKLIQVFRLTSKSGLTDNFISWLSCDDESNIWAASPSGLDKIHIENDSPIIENLTRQNNMYQFMYSVVTDKNNITWAMGSEGLIRISPVSNSTTGYLPRLMITQIRVGANELDQNRTTLSYKQNNLSFYFTAPSFLGEKQILYSYMLKGSSHAEWSEPSNNAFASFIDLRPGDYTLHIKVKFPAGRYPEQSLEYHFLITPPWWQTWWFRITAGVLITGLIIMGVRSYYRRKLERQQMILEKQQAIEEERKRIAADMHDDLGAGLTRIKYIAEHILEKTDSGETVQLELQKLKNFSSELVESMGEIIWAVSEKNNLLSSTLYYLRSYAINYCEENNIDCDFEIPESFKDRIISGNIRRNIFLLLKESLHNIVKHACAKAITIKAGITENFELIIKDDGKGFSNNRDTQGNGLINMKKRVQELKGSIRFENNKGAAVIIDLPFNPNQSTIG